MKKLLIGLSVAFVLGVSGVLGYFYQNPITKNVLDGNYVYQETIESLIEESDIVAIVQTKQDFRERKQEISHLDNEKTVVEAEWSMTDLNIKKLIKTDDTSIKKGDTITVAEHFAMDGIQLKTMMEYVPIAKNEKYLVFLKKHPNGYYTIFDINNGRYQLTGKEHVDRGEFKEFEQKILKKYEKELKEELKEN